MLVAVSQVNTPPLAAELQAERHALLESIPSPMTLPEILRDDRPRRLRVTKTILEEQVLLIRSPIHSLEHHAGHTLVEAATESPAGYRLELLKVRDDDTIRRMGLLLQGLIQAPPLAVIILTGLTPGGSRR